MPLLINKKLMVVSMTIYLNMRTWRLICLAHYVVFIIKNISTWKYPAPSLNIKASVRSRSALAAISSLAVAVGDNIIWLQSSQAAVSLSCNGKVTPRRALTLRRTLAMGGGGSWRLDFFFFHILAKDEHWGKLVAYTRDNNAFTGISPSKRRKLESKVEVTI